MIATLTTSDLFNLSIQLSREDSILREIGTETLCLSPDPLDEFSPANFTY